jgi:uncharacterized protein Yka (UPF0111/DUF47 family)
MFLPKEKKFFHLYNDLADKIVESVALLEALGEDYSRLQEIAKKLDKVESQADKIVHKIMNDLLYDHTRVTEEKGDIKFFAHNMDNVIDSIEKAVNRLCVYKIDFFPKGVAEFVPILKQSAKEIKKAVECLPNMRKNQEKLAKYCVKINQLENKADQVNRKWLEAVLSQPVKNANDMRQIIALKEIIDMLEYAMDQCEDVANILETFRLKGEA